MDLVLVVARILLAAVFIVAGVGKLLDLRGAKAAMEGFGLPSSIARPAAIALPIAEIVVAILLLPKATAWYGAIGAMVLLGAFALAIAYNMSQGRHPDCHCFGQIHSEPAGWPTLIRNVVLGGVALFVVLFGRDIFAFSNEDAGYSMIGWFGDLSTWEQVVTILGIAGLIVLAVQSWLVVHLLGQNGRVLLRLDAMEASLAAGGEGLIPSPAQAAPLAPPAGLPVGSPAPAFKLEGVHGETMTLDALRSAGKQVMLIFSDPGCGPCNALLPDIARWQNEHANRLTLAVVSRGGADANRGKAVEHGLSHVLLQKNREVSGAYQASGTPSAVVVNQEGMIATPVAAGSEAIRQLVTQVTDGGAKPTVPMARPGQANGSPSGAASKVGQAAPAVSLPDLSGKTVNLSDFKGSDTLVVFWNPGCGFCKRMTDEIKEWEAQAPKSAPKLLIVSTGTVEANKEMGFASTVVLDEGFSTGRSFGASGTPSAVLVDKNGKIASELGVGSPSVMALAKGEKVPAQAAAPEPPPALKKGQAAPQVKLKTVDGDDFALTDLKGKKSMLLFWNPGCGFCKRMVDDLNGWLAAKPKTAPEVILVSTGTPESNKEMGINTTILLDEGFATGRKFGASGTPSAILIDEKGKVASEIAVGAPAVMGLAGAPKQDQQPISA
jgi:peroxiredoxin/uncharacterized membrane protein YphA (DoxX/SURF4 family)